MLTVPETTTTDLIERCRQGDDAAWRSLVDRYARLVRATAAQHSESADDIDDVAQEVFLSLARSLQEIEDPERLPGWLVTTTRRACWRLAQRRRSEHRHVSTDMLEESGSESKTMAISLPSLTSLLDSWHRQDILAQSLNLLPDRCRRLLLLLFLDRTEPSYDEISRRLDLPVGSIGPTRTRCLAKLRSVLEAAGYRRVDL